MQASPPGFGILSFAVTVDDYFNVYVSVGGSLSLPGTLSGSIRGAGGWILGEQVAAKGRAGVGGFGEFPYWMVGKFRWRSWHWRGRSNDTNA